MPFEAGSICKTLTGLSLIIISVKVLYDNDLSLLISYHQMHGGRARPKQAPGIARQALSILSYLSTMQLSKYICGHKCRSMDISLLQGHKADTQKCREIQKIYSKPLFIQAVSKISLLSYPAQRHRNGLPRESFYRQVFLMEFQSLENYRDPGIQVEGTHSMVLPQTAVPSCIRQIEVQARRRRE
jgi:hypothetical protein